MSEWFYFILWKNEFMKFLTFSFWKYIYEWMIFFLDLFLFSFHMYACIIFFWECIYKWNFWECVYDVRNSRKVYKRFCECICRYSQADNTSMKIYFLFSFKFSIFLIITHEWMLEIVISKFFNDMHECLLYIVFFFNDNLCSNVFFF